MADEPLERVSKLWEKISETVVQGLKTGKDELLRTSKMGKIRLDISTIKNRIGGKQKELGREVYELWLAKKVGIAELEGIFAEIKHLDDQIKEKEREIESLIEEKQREAEAPPIAEVKPIKPVSPVTEPQVEPKLKKQVTKKKTTKKSASITKTGQGKT